MSLMRLTSELAINPEEVVSMKREHRDYINGSDNYLIIEMKNGKSHRLQHGYGVNVFKIEDEIMDTKRGDWY